MREAVGGLGPVRGRRRPPPPHRPSTQTALHAQLHAIALFYANDDAGARADRGGVGPSRRGPPPDRARLPHQQQRLPLLDERLVPR